MWCCSVRSCGGWLFAALLLSPHQHAAAQAPERPAASTTAPSAAAMAEYRRKLEEYAAARRRYEAEADVYWRSVADKRRLRHAKLRNNQEILLSDYVLTQPPVYVGPPKPIDPSAPTEEAPPRTYVPVVADFLRAAAKEFNFVPQQPRNEIEYKRAYVKVAVAAGLTKEQVVRIYALESGGDGKYDVQAGLEQPKPGARAISTALGYNQLLATNSVELLAEKGDQFIKILSAKAAGLPEEAKKSLQKKIAVLKSMIAFCRTVPDSWSEHDRLAKTPKGLAVHALNLDVDIGPLLQTQKLLDSVVFARAQGYGAILSAAELEMMNLTGDGNGLDILRMPAAWRERVPTSNFFQPGGYERNPIAGRSGVVSRLIAATNAVMDQESKLQGAKDLAALFANKHDSQNEVMRMPGAPVR
jgi:hypothetical protein